MLPRFSTNSSIFFRISPCTLCQLSQHVRLLGLHGPVDCTAPGHHHHAVGSPRLRVSSLPTAAGRKMPQIHLLKHLRYFNSGCTWLNSINAPEDPTENRSTDSQVVNPINQNIQRDETLFYDNYIKVRPKKLSITSNTHEQIPIKKNYFSPTPQLLQRSSEAISQYMIKNGIRVNKIDVPPPVQKFSDIELPDAIMTLLQQQYAQPTAIQSMGLSLALSGRDVIGVGQTGSGKTLAYVLPMLLHTAHQQEVLPSISPCFSHNSPVAVVLAPTRELARQIASTARRYSIHVGVEVMLVSGGVFWKKQCKFLRHNKPKFLVATPGRLLDLLESGQLRLGQCSFVVLDEADRMLDMGFKPQISSIMQHTRSDRQTLMWSATWPSEVQQLASSFLSDAVQLTVGSTELRANPDIVQHVHVVEFLEKTALLKKLLREGLTQNPEGKALVFAQSQRDVGKIVQRLRDGSFQCGFIHGGLDQLARNEVISDFRKGRFNVLVATDVAARGLDIPDLSCVINHDMPDTVATYVHRVGRTGRCGRPGVAHTFFSQRNISKSVALVHLLQEAGQRVDPKLLYMAAKRRFTPYGDSEVFLPFVPEKTAIGELRSQSLLGTKGGRVFSPNGGQGLTGRELAFRAASLRRQAMAQSALDKRKDKSKVVNLKYCLQRRP